jgi:hypothetical protein
MRILLVNTNAFKDPLPVLPMGLCWIAASLERAGHTVSLLDLCFSVTPGRDVCREVKKFSPHLVGLGVRNIDTCNGYRPVFLLGHVKEHVVTPLKGVFSGPVVVGGPAAGINAAELLDFFDLPYAVQGDGEHAMLEIAACLEAGKDPSAIAGLVTRKNGAVISSNAPAFTDDLDGLPVPDVRKYLNLALYNLHNTPFQVQTKRGCALTCSYCTYNRLEGRTYRFRSPSAIADEIERFTKTTGIRTVEIVDSTFNVPLDHAKAFLREMVSRRLGLRLSTLGLNPRFVDAEFVALMRKAGFIEACFGIEAAADPMLKAFSKNFTMADIRSAARLFHRSHIPVSWFLIMGGPGETPASVDETIRAIGKIASPLDLINIGVGLRVYNGAPVADVWSAEHGGPPPDHFFRPVAYQPEPFTMKQLKARMALATALHHNFFMFDDGANVLLPIRMFFGVLFPSQPLWRLYIVMRLLEKISGVFLVRALVSWIIWKREMRKGLTSRHSKP